MKKLTDEQKDREAKKLNNAIKRALENCKLDPQVAMYHIACTVVSSIIANLMQRKSDVDVTILYEVLFSSIYDGTMQMFQDDQYSIHEVDGKED